MTGADVRYLIQRGGHLGKRPRRLGFVGDEASDRAWPTNSKILVVELHPDLVDWPDTRPVRGALVGVVNTLREQDQDRVIATLDDLAELLPGRAPQSTARALREAGWLFGMRTRGVWGFAGARLGAPRAPGYLELHARMRVRPDTPACIAGKTVAMLHGWLWRPVESDIGMPPGVKVPRCLGDFGVHRWEPRIGLD
ncbi:MAG: hypothetical protein OXF41_03425, partial [bacterium]|nr:hypothetical protein [bacterium]